MRKNILAIVKGNSENPKLKGVVTFSQMQNGTWVSAVVSGLPIKDGFMGFHLHSGSECNPDDSFTSAGSHYNPTNAKHPGHAGDFPSLLVANGTARLQFFTNRFTPQEAIGKTVIIHSDPDDFRTDPSGNSGSRIACGVIVKA